MATECNCQEVCEHHNSKSKYGAPTYNTIGIDERCVIKEPTDKKENNGCCIAVAILLVSNIMLICTVLTFVK